MLCNHGHECDINPCHYSPFNWSLQTKTKYCDQFICLFVYLMGLCSFDERSCYMVRAFHRPNNWAWFESWRFLMLKANRCYLQWNQIFVHRFQFLWFSFVLCLFFYILYNFANKAGIHIHTKSQTSQYNQQLMWDHFEYVVIQMWKVCATQFFLWCLMTCHSVSFRTDMTFHICSESDYERWFLFCYPTLIQYLISFFRPLIRKKCWVVFMFILYC